MDDKSLVFQKIILPALGDTLYMVILSTIFATIIGFCLAIVLVISDKNGLKPNVYIYKTLDFIINVIRSFPFIILVISIIPITRFVVGTSIGKNAAVFPLSIIASALVARLIEGSLKEVDPGMIKAARAFGASNMQIIFKVMLKEATPSICNSIILATIAILGSSAMAGAIGAGGVGSVAIIYGYQSFNDYIIYTCVVILVILVQVIQTVGNKIYRKLK